MDTRTVRHVSGDFMARILCSLVLLQGLQQVTAFSLKLHAVEANNSSVLQNLPEQLKRFFHHVYSGLHDSHQLQLHLPDLKSFQEGFSSVATTSATIFFLVYLVTLMTNWARSIWNGGRPRLLSPFGSRQHPPKVTENDYSYITSAEITQPGRTYNQTKKPPPGPGIETVGDVLVLKNGVDSYPIRFPVNSIYEGKLRVIDVKERLAAVLNLPRGGERIIDLQYKGISLNEDLKACRDYGLKNESWIYFTIDSKTSHSDESTVDSENPEDKKKRRRGRKGKKAASRRREPSISHQEVSRSSRSVTPPTQRTSGPIDKLTKLSNHLHTNLAPLCYQFIESPPEDEKKKEFEYRKLSETMMNEVVLKLDAVETDGDNDAREMRKAIVKEAQEVLIKLDAVMAK
ncbi:hypothetical protein HI914_05253 [Erysiphe necator]|uniref:Putative bag domain-containing protein n=1 Tax=Uncinula necator TaxID=52586 RepID=A0A0B1NVW1_UNCNE|nr:hypothetical protein HI914_05253 [Erysiphe necator]KHJ30113.1 putative bag domain-containing protein [Erysiphe necator]